MFYVSKHDFKYTNKNNKSKQCLELTMSYVGDLA